MSDIILLGTRKGTVIIDRSNSTWHPRAIEHAGIPVYYAARDPRDGTLWASLDHGHWGPKLSRSRDGGKTALVQFNSTHKQLILNGIATTKNIERVLLFS
jgi:hypothetical protein